MTGARPWREPCPSFRLRAGWGPRWESSTCCLCLVNRKSIQREHHLFSQQIANLSRNALAVLLRVPSTGPATVTALQ